MIYHSIAPFEGHGSKDLYVTPENFKKQMTYLKDNGYTLLTFEDWDKISSVPKPIFITFDDGYKNNETVWTIFKQLTTESFHPKATLFVISDFVDRPNRLSEEDLKQMANSGYFSIQSHTATHPDLTKATNLTYQLGESKTKLEKITGKPVIALSYPFGLYNQKVINVAKKYYKYGITTDRGFVGQQAKTDALYKLPRIYVKYSTTIEDFAHTILQD